ncbi:MAG: tRNA dihydrouridine synthase DusB [Lachnospiraceae bacterium]|nr:tRNA dihydrouridine synthase DusB [Lachnospiraceae bacterium]
MDMFKIGHVEIKNRVCVAPMAGITDLPYRLILKEMGASLLTTELVSSKGIFYKNPGNATIMATDRREAPIALQLFGSDPIIMAKVASDVMEPYDIVDINMGCPVLKVVRNGEGAALMKDISLAVRIVETMVRVIDGKKPVTCKMRIGYDNNHINVVEFAKAMEEAGASAITVHGRTKTELYSGDCHRDVIRKVKEAVRIPVIANGNIWTIYDAKKTLDETEADAVALGRAIKGNPWFVRECIEYIENDNVIDRPTIDEIKSMMRRHIDDAIRFKGEYTAITELRHHIAWYTHGMENSTKFRLKLNSITTKEDLIDLINDL